MKFRSYGAAGDEHSHSGVGRWNGKERGGLCALHEVAQNSSGLHTKFLGRILSSCILLNVADVVQPSKACELWALSQLYLASSIHNPKCCMGSCDAPSHLSSSAYALQRMHT